AADQGQSGAREDSDHRRDVVRAERRRREGAGGRLRRLRDEAVQPAGTAGEGEGIPGVRDPPRILVVDDSPVNVDLLRTRLAVHGYDILTAGDGEAALEVARQQQPDLILLDVMVP